MYFNTFFGIPECCIFFVFPFYFIPSQWKLLMIYQCMNKLKTCCKPSLFGRTNCYNCCKLIWATAIILVKVCGVWSWCFRGKKSLNLVENKFQSSFIFHRFIIYMTFFDLSGILSFIVLIITMLKRFFVFSSFNFSW